MAFKGARSDPVQGIKGSKPRLRRPKLPRRPETAESAKLGEEYLRKRNALLDLKVTVKVAPCPELPYCLYDRDTWAGSQKT